MYSIIEISGGIGKNIMATAVIAGIKKEFPDRKILVVTAYPAVFLNNPNIYRVFQFGKCPYFYADYVENKDVIFFCEEPYRSHGYLKQDRHLIHAWADCLNLYHCETEPKLYLNQREIEICQNKINVQKPILIFQPFGGAENKDLKYTWNRDIPPVQAQNIVNILASNYHIVQPVWGNQIRLNNCEHINIALRQLFCLVSFANRIIGIDSSIQHIAKALNKPATVCWVTNTPTVFGYDLHNNIFPKKEAYKDKKDNIDGYFIEYDFSGSREYDYPFKDDKIFNITEIIESDPNQTLKSGIDSFQYKGSKITYRLGTTDENVIDEVLNRQNYQKRIFLDPNPTIIDVGAHIGTFSLYAKKQYPNSKIYAFEPQKDNFELLIENIVNNDLDVKVFRKGVAGEKGIANLYLGDTQSHSIEFPIDNPEEKEEIECITLKDIIDNNHISKVDLLKLDCEGAEYNILLKTEKEYLSRIQNIIMEYHIFNGKPIVPFEDLETFMIENGFELTQKEENHRSEKLITGEAIFIRKELLERLSSNEGFIDSYFDKIYLINLDRREDRWLAVQKQLEQANIKTAERISATELTDEDLEKTPKHIYRNFRSYKIKPENKERFEKKYIKGQLGCRNSHLTCIKHAKENGYKKILILEDDIEIVQDCNQQFFNIISKIGNEWNMLYFGGEYRGTEIYQTSSYALDEKLYDEIIETMEDSGDEVDFYYIANIQQQHHAIRIDPPLMKQLKLDSDIPTEGSPE